MALCPFATIRLLAPPPAQRTIRPTQIVDHTMESTLSATDTRLRRPDVCGRSHFGIGWDGTIVQWLDTTQAAEAAHRADHRADGTGAVSITTEGHTTQTWSDAQLDALTRLHVWLMRTHPSIARRACRSAGDPGLGHHLLFGSPGPWTPVPNSCPGPGRIAQWHDVLLPRVLAAFGVSVDDMRTPEQIGEEIIRELLGTSTEPPDDDASPPPAASQPSTASQDPAGPPPKSTPPPAPEPESEPPPTRSASPAEASRQPRPWRLQHPVMAAVRDFFLPDSAPVTRP